MRSKSLKKKITILKLIQSSGGKIDRLKLFKLGFLLSEVIGTKNNWAERKIYILAKGTKTMCYLQLGHKRLRRL